MDMKIKGIQDKLTEAGLAISEEDLKARFDLLKGFGVTEEEIIRSVTNHYATQGGVDMKSFYSGGTNPECKINTLNKENMWGTVRVKVVQLWNSEHASIGQVGLVGDETGTVKFTAWASANALEMEEGKCYLIKNVVSSVFNERIQIGINKKSTIELVTDEIEVGYEKVTIVGALVNIQNGSGLIKRCPQCNRSLRNGVCSEHGKVQGTYDVRIKGSLDDGIQSHSVLLNTELTEQITGMSVDASIAMAIEAMDQSVVVGEFENRLLCRFFIVEGSKMDQTILVSSITPLAEIGQEDIQLLKTAIPAEVA
ncbi:replication factor A [Patescibacteria group bacterium]|nr:replication factor A [Patescibacteria group bacterium]